VFKKALITATNDRGEARVQFHTVTDGHGQFERPINGLIKALKYMAAQKGGHACAPAVRRLCMCGGLSEAALGFHLQQRRFLRLYY